ncbi:hypothetical protein [Chitinophaga nivalis]|uniref:DKNYY domain-containing protein n=1 Tax=Chitinophaga nivalis TaxID=2991709 RepID=A0ABT3IV20_9BACT|nr:hypothetical protein [Chitinophaga nivalis]MCW3462516.1 hypothetical protein [Chitinophaga nivalis]MCW3487793.1 hypothetical protein [Chitinophaga nivalis]
MKRNLVLLILSGSMALLWASCQKNELNHSTEAALSDKTAAVQVSKKGPQSCFSGTYIDTMHYNNTPQLYIFNGNQYTRYDVLANTFNGVTSISNYPNMPFGSIDASYVDYWHYGGRPQLYMFSGNQYARYDMKNNSFEGTTAITNFPNMPFTSVDAAYVDTWHYGGRPQLYLFSGNRYARYDILANTFEGTTSITNFPNMPFTSVDAAYVDTWHYGGRPQLYLFSGGIYARYDIWANTYEGVNTVASGYAGSPFCH